MELTYSMTYFIIPTWRFMGSRESERREHTPGSAESRFAASVLHLIESNAQPGSAQLRFLDRLQGVLVDIEFGSYQSPRTARIPLARRLGRRGHRRKNLAEGISILVVDTTKVKEAEAAEHKEVRAALLRVKKGEKAGGRVEVESHRVTRNIGAYPELSHEIPATTTTQGLLDFELDDYADMVDNLNPDDAIFDISTSRTKAEVEEDAVLASEFVGLVEDSDRNITASVYLDNKASLGLSEIHWMNEAGGLSLLTFIPDINGSYYLVRQIQHGQEWQVTEYMVDLQDVVAPQIYKSQHTVIKNITEPEMIGIPPLIDAEMTNHSTAHLASQMKYGLLSEVIKGDHRVSRVEFDDLVEFSREAIRKYGNLSLDE